MILSCSINSGFSKRFTTSLTLILTVPAWLLFINVPNQIQCRIEKIKYFYQWMKKNYLEKLNILLKSLQFEKSINWLNFWKTNKEKASFHGCARTVWNQRYMNDLIKLHMKVFTIGGLISAELVDNVQVSKVLDVIEAVWGTRYNFSGAVFQEVRKDHQWLHNGFEKFVGFSWLFGWFGDCGCFDDFVVVLVILVKSF